MIKALKLIDNKYRNQFLFIMFALLLMSVIYFKYSNDMVIDIANRDKEFFLAKYGKYNVEAYTVFEVAKYPMNYKNGIVNLLSGNVSLYLSSSIFIFILCIILGGVEKVTKFGNFTKTIPISKTKIYFAKTLYLMIFALIYVVISCVLTSIVIYTSLYKLNGYVQDGREICMYFFVMSIQLFIIIMVMMFINSITGNFIGHIFTAVPIFGGAVYLCATLAILEYIFTNDVNLANNIFNRLLMDSSIIGKSIAIPFLIVPMSAVKFFFAISGLLLIIGAFIEPNEELEMVGTVYKFKIFRYIFMIMLIINVSGIILIIMGNVLRNIPNLLLFIIFCAIIYLPIKKLFEFKIG